MEESKLAGWWREVQGSAIFFYQRVLTRTARWQVEGREHLEQAKASGRPLLWAFWHAQVMPFITYGDRYEGSKNFVMVVVGDDRFDILGTLANRLGAEGFRVDMQGNPVSAGRSVLRVIKAMKGGKQSFIAPDGPDGPAFVPKRGVAFLAQKARAAILPIGAWTKHAYEMDRWDRYIVPYPFAKFNLVVGKPIMAEPKMEEQSLLHTITESLDSTRTRAQELSGITPWR